MTSRVGADVRPESLMSIDDLESVVWKLELGVAVARLLGEQVRGHFICGGVRQMYASDGESRDIA